MKKSPSRERYVALQAISSELSGAPLPSPNPASPRRALRGTGAPARAPCPLRGSASFTTGRTGMEALQILHARVPSPIAGTRTRSADHDRDLRTGVTPLHPSTASTRSPITRGGRRPSTRARAVCIGACTPRARHRDARGAHRRALPWCPRLPSHRDGATLARSRFAASGRGTSASAWRRRRFERTRQWRSCRLLPRARVSGVFRGENDRSASFARRRNRIATPPPRGESPSRRSFSEGEKACFRGRKPYFGWS
jgi:hypothetical protein